LDNPAEVKESYDHFKRALDIAKTLECDLVRVFTFLRRPAALDESTLKRIVEHLRKLLEIASGSGIRIGVENESSCIIGTGDETLRLIAQLPDKQFGIIWDPCNCVY